jgi:hypothetical protein
MLLCLVLSKLLQYYKKSFVVYRFINKRNKNKVCYFFINLTALSIFIHYPHPQPCLLGILKFVTFKLCMSNPIGNE